MSFMIIIIIGSDGMIRLPSLLKFISNSFFCWRRSESFTLDKTCLWGALVEDSPLKIAKVHLKLTQQVPWWMGKEDWDLQQSFAEQELAVF